MVTEMAAKNKKLTYDWSYSDIADEMGCTIEQIIEIENSVLMKLRKV